MSTTTVDNPTPSPKPLDAAYSRLGHEAAEVFSRFGDHSEELGEIARRLEHTTEGLFDLLINGHPETPRDLARAAYAYRTHATIAAEVASRLLVLVGRVESLAWVGQHMPDEIVQEQKAAEQARLEARRAKPPARSPAMDRLFAAALHLRQAMRSAEPSKVDPALAALCDAVDAGGWA